MDYTYKKGQSGDFEKIKKIPLEERDIVLDLHCDWPPQIPNWNTKDPGGNRKNYLYRTIPTPENPKLVEAIIRFPSAPVYGIHRKYEYQYKLPRINYHTMRLLRRPWPGETPSQVERIYLIHNGLNETDYLGFYYTFADLLLDQKSACIIRPLPGHLRFESPPP